MPSIRDSRTVLAASTVTNILAGSKFEFMPQAAAVMVYAVQDLAVGGPVVMDVTFGNVVEGDGLIVPQNTVGLGPDTQNHMIASGVAAPGDRLQISLQNTHATVNTPVRTLVVIRPL